MQLSISNLAWAPQDDAAIAGLLAERQIRYVDLAPSLYFGDLATCSQDQTASVRQAWGERGVSLVGLQSLFFGLDGLSFLGPASDHERIESYFRHVCRVAVALGAHHLVLGSPSMRRGSHLPETESTPRLLSLLRRLGDVAAQTECLLHVEPNAATYGGTVLTTTRETAALVRCLQHPNVSINLDSGAVLQNQECVDTLALECADVVGYVHISLPHLKPLSHASPDQRDRIAHMLQAFSPARVTLEMSRQPRAYDTVANSLDAVLPIVARARGTGAATATRTP